MSENTPTRPVDRRQFTIGIICALTIEADMVEMIFDKDWSDEKDYGKASGDPNTYTTGIIAGHNIVLAYCSGSGSNSAAYAAMGLKSSFTGVKIVFVVGICGVTPTNRETGQPIMLGDCIISTSVVQYDIGRQGPSGFQRKTGFDNLGRADVETRSRITKLKTRKNTLKLETDAMSHLQHLQEVDPDRSQHPGNKEDQLFSSDYLHEHHSPVETCAECNAELGICQRSCEQLGCQPEHLVQRSIIRNSAQPRVHFGCFGTANTVLKSGLDRDKLANDDGFIAFEMEASGVWDVYPTMLIKGACDYADSHKNKKWQAYSAAVAAAGLKAFLQQLKLPAEELPPLQVNQGQNLSLMQMKSIFVAKASQFRRSGLQYTKMKNYERAEPYWRELYKINETEHGLRNAQTLDALYFLGCTYSNQYKTLPSKVPLAVDALEKCFNLRTEVLGSDHPHVKLMKLDLGKAYSRNGQFDNAEQLLSPAMEDLLPPAMDSILAGNTASSIEYVKALLETLGESQWKLHQRDKAKSTYCRLASISLLEDSWPTQAKVLIRTAPDSPNLQKYWELYCLIVPEPFSGRFIFRERNLKCDRCRVDAGMKHGYHHCLECFNIAFCESCFRHLQALQPSSATCIKNHEFMQVKWEYWRITPFPYSIKDEQRMPAESWLENFRREFIEMIKSEDAPWMQWFERTRGR